MKIILDTDGTLTDFNKYVADNAYKYFTKKYNMPIKYPYKLEIEDIFDMDNFFQQKYCCTPEQAKEYTKKALDKFWVSLRFINFSLMNKFRPGVKEFINQKLREGHTFEVHTSRGKTCERGIVGAIARKFTIIQYKLNGIFLPKDCFHFYKDDQEKINGIINSSADLVLDDKPEIIEELVKHKIKCICVEGVHNQNIEPNENLGKISSFTHATIHSEIEKLFGIKNLEIYERAARSDIFFAKLVKLKPIIMHYFNPVVLHEENLIEPRREGVIYAPNHRSTLDPIVITGIINANIHWAALLRFFQGNDSIFNNSKNPTLCKITSKTFKKLEYFPIDRKSDNPKANNFKSIIDMVKFLQANQRVGIFPEGTTRRPEGEEFGNFDDAFIVLSQKTDSWIQPITTLWIKELNLKEKLIINIGKPIKVGKMGRKEAYKLYLEIQKAQLRENKAIKEELEKNSIQAKKLSKKK